MKEEIFLVLNELCNNDINKHEAADKIEAILLKQNPDILGALNSSVQAIYFADRSDYLTYHWSVIRYLKNDFNSDIDIGKLYRELNGVE